MLDPLLLIQRLRKDDTFYRRTQMVGSNGQVRMVRASNRVIRLSCAASTMQSPKEITTGVG